MTFPLIPNNATFDVVVLTFLSMNPIIVPLFLFGLYLILVGGGYLMEERRTGTGNFRAWAAIAGFILSIIVTLLYLVPGITNAYTVTVVYGVTIASVMWFILGE